MGKLAEYKARSTRDFPITLMVYSCAGPKSPLRKNVHLFTVVRRRLRLRRKYFPLGRNAICRRHISPRFPTFPHRIYKRAQSVRAPYTYTLRRRSDN